MGIDPNLKRGINIAIQLQSVVLTPDMAASGARGPIRLRSVVTSGLRQRFGGSGSWREWDVPAPRFGGYALDRNKMLGRRSVTTMLKAGCALRGARPRRAGLGTGAGTAVVATDAQHPRRRRQPALTQGDREIPRRRTRSTVAKVTYTKAPAPELAGKIKAQQNAGRVDIDLVLTGTDGWPPASSRGCGSSCCRSTPTGSARPEGNYLRGAAKMQKLAEDSGDHRRLLPVRPAARVHARRR